jgi:hypothetical protein
MQKDAKNEAERVVGRVTKSMDEKFDQDLRALTFGEIESKFISGEIGLGLFRAYVRFLLSVNKHINLSQEPPLVN